MSLSDEYLDGVNEQVAVQDAIEQNRVVVGDGELTPQQIDKMVAPVVQDRATGIISSLASALSQVLPALTGKAKPDAAAAPLPPQKSSVDVKKVALIGAASVAGVGVLWLAVSAMKGRGRR